MIKIDGVEIIGLEIELYGEQTLGDEIDLGALTLRSGEREYILDTIESSIAVQAGMTNISVKLGEDREIFSECKYDLTSKDLMFGVNGEFYINSGDLVVESITLFVKFNDTSTKAIDISEE